MESTLPKYKNPPVVEVVIGASLAPIGKLSSIHYGAFWEKVKKEYPFTEDNVPLANETSLGQVEMLQMPPLRRVFLIHTDRTYLMQIQPDRFVHNWRKNKDSDQYPNFEAAREKFLRGWNLFKEFLKDASLGEIELRSYEVTYINHLIEAPGSFPSATESYLPLFSWGSARSMGFLPNPDLLTFGLRFPLPEEKGTLKVNMGHGKRAADNADLMLLQLTAQGPARPDGSDMEAWLELAHKWIVCGFTDLTSASAHKKWERYQ
jgi:uncharacterized protein (TIGR04255 family)